MPKVSSTTQIFTNAGDWIVYLLHRKGLHFVYAQRMKPPPNNNNGRLYIGNVSVDLLKVEKEYDLICLAALMDAMPNDHGTIPDDHPLLLR